MLFFIFVIIKAYNANDKKNKKDKMIDLRGDMKKKPLIVSSKARGEEF